MRRRSELICPHGMPSRAACVDCMMDGPVMPPKRWVKVGGPFRSQFSGASCPGSCGRLIVEGEMIQRWDLEDQRTAYAHVGCQP